MSVNWKELSGWASVQGQWLRRRHFNAEMLGHLAEQIRKGEENHSGELVVAIEAVLPAHEADSAQRALEVFGRLRVWDTPLNSGVLLYLALGQRRIHIIADRGIKPIRLNGRRSVSSWKKIWPRVSICLVCWPLSARLKPSCSKELQRRLRARRQSMPCLTNLYFFK
ncbi:hypothetical protein C660_14559 [Alcaligenes sp. HPC1271]|nr:TPM domain-containing protein [Alcaligenes sp. HPC1271]EKU29455.1 hypothetical protein C660_14559 [Alcaligenes sp. HPC1271]